MTGEDKPRLAPVIHVDEADLRARVDELRRQIAEHEAFDVWAARQDLEAALFLLGE